MPDISMCNDIFCPVKDDCYRFTATPSYFTQLYADFQYDKLGKCDYFYDNKLIK